ncbi:B12-binding domain-containing radical SAM protein [Polyangium sorediatum]|uniref:Radical SAM protein n=1 Tax=Polyangium sorediatum TaxID=889274 RepID=A0ABT6P135_9BACT|nr:radical SAM protein [Polyangium sorediatum]MDI1434302.1 radical SAM protein [Polyangium sorediatum]
MKVRIVVDYVPRYRHGHQWHFVPPVTGIHLAAITPSEHEVEVIHEQVRPVPVDTTPDVVALSFFSGFARRAYQLADRYRALGVRVVAGGPHVSYWTEEALEHVDVVVTGEAESVWPELLRDLDRGTPRRVYRGEPASLAGLPTPRYDLLEDRFLVPRVLQATRGCPFTCSFCTVPDLNPGFRVRPVDDVVRDIATTRFPRFWQDKVAWFWDDNLLVQRRWAKELLRAMVGLDRWWLTQASIDIVKDRELLDLMERSGCIGIFLGIESLDEADLRSVDKRQNRVREYRDAIERLHDRGICVMAGFISGFDDQTPETIVATADRLNAVGVDVPFLSVLTPFRGTPLYDEYLRDGRILTERDWGHYTGYGVAFRPAKMRPDELLTAHRRLWNRAFSPALVMDRLARGARQLSRGGMMLSAAMNGFYGLKQLLGNEPASPPIDGEGQIVHPDPREAPLRLSQIGVRRAEKKNAAGREEVPAAAHIASAAGLR